MNISSGERLGPYEILDRIGSGGMGEVWKARDTRLNRIVAIKRLKSEHSTRFEQEARAIAALNHPHICQIYDVGPDYLVLEYLEGAPPAGPLAPADVVPLALEIAAAIEAAHAEGILHRDLKPGNILLTRRGAKLLDFGLAKLVADNEATQTKGISGTPMYMSPEQAEGKPLDARSDVFSFGAVLYELLAGKRAFPSLAAVLRDDPARLPVSSELDSIVMRCLAKGAAQRFQTMSEVRAALERVRALPSGERPSIAVLPFVNMSRDADDEYFSDGLAEEIINALVKVSGLRVIARTSAFAFKGQNIDIRKIAEILGVSHVLEGSVRRAGARIRVTAQLIIAADGSHLWSERYDRQMDDLFAMQDEIAEAIAGELKLKFAPAAHPRRQPNLQAYEAYLRYRQYQWAFTPEALTRSRECLEQAIALDPQFALPYVGLADHYFASTTFGGAADLVPRARALAERALALDPDLPEAHGMLGVLAGFWNPDWKEAERRFAQAIAREPIPWHVRSWYSSFYLCPLARLAEARREAERAIEDNPLSQLLYWCLANTLAAAGLEPEALAAYEKTVELDPHYWLGFWTLGLHHAVYGKRAEARACAEKAFAIFPHPFNTGLLAGVLRACGETARAESLMQQISGHTPGGSLALACFHLVAGEIDQAVEWAGKAMEEGYPMTENMFIVPFQSVLRQSRFWPRLMKTLNLP